MFDARFSCLILQNSLVKYVFKVKEVGIYLIDCPKIAKKVVVF